MEIKKSPKADLEKGKTLSILMGFVVGLAVLFVGFEWSTRDVMVVQASEGVADIIAEEEVEITGEYASSTSTTSSTSCNRGFERC